MATQPKLTLLNLHNLVKGIIASGEFGISEDNFTLDRNDFTNLVVKIGKQIMNDSTFTDRLAELDAEELPLGTTIEEYFFDLAPTVAHDPDGANNMAPKDLAKEKNYYSNEFPRRTVTVTIRDNAYNNAMLSFDALSSLVARILKRLHDSYTVHKYTEKRHLLGAFADKFVDDQVISIAKPVDTATGEAWTKRVKKLHTEMADFITEKYSINKVIATAPSLVLYVKGSDINPTIDVDVLAGAFNANRAEVPVTIKQIEDFGELTNHPDAYAILIDPRGVAMHMHNLNSTFDRNGLGEFTNHHLHFTNIGYTSPFTNGVVFVEPSGN